MNKEKIEGGYLFLPRIMKDWPIMKTAPVNRELFLYILMNVMFTDYKGLKRGQGYFRLQKIQEDLSWQVGFRTMKYSKPQLTKSLRRQRELRMIETTKATHGILITVCNYDYYQDAFNYEGNDEGNRESPRRKQKGINIKNECNNECNNESKEDINIAKRQADFKEEVESFVENYPIEMLTAFYVYWSEPNQTKSKMKKELEKTWDTAHRLVTWKNNQESWKRR